MVNDLQGAFYRALTVNGRKISHWREISSRYRTMRPDYGSLNILFRVGEQDGNILAYMFISHHLKLILL